MKMIATNAIFSCRIGCGACCIAPSLSSRTPGMGITFTQINPEDQATIRAFINRQLMQDLARGLE